MKSRKFWAFAVFVGLVVSYAIYDYRSSQTEEEEMKIGNLILGYPAEQISEFSIQSQGQVIELKKDKEGWKMLKPVQDEGDKAAADQFVEGIATERSSEIASEGEAFNLSQYGLDQPKGVITVTNNLGKKTEFRVGTIKNFQGDAFVMKGQEKKVLIGSSTWFAKVDKTAMDFRDRRLMRLPNAGAEKVLLEKGKERIELQKKDGNWSLASHPEWKLDQNRVRELLAMLHTTEALEFIAGSDVKAEELQKWGLKNPRLKMTVSLKDEKFWTAGFAAGNDKVHRVQVNPPQFVLKISPTDSDKFYQMTEDYFRDRAEPFQFDKALVREIEIKLGDVTGTLKADEEKAKTLLTKISNLKAADFQGQSQAKLTHEILLKGEKGEILRFQWGGLHNSSYSAQSSLHSQRFTVYESDISNLKLEELLKKESAK